ncbi:cytochrome-c peroxidase [Vibrio mediterranei]|uniref:cytochrome-c peroxidase n=1 Tax=Vibrio mediterranei TaxID=689 RepID=UPI00148E3120|nr:cytochrome c peroxidase [Vibrio mediterranei]NOH30233.1 cytochrome B6 [Vibrio mediterranei]
MNKILIRWLSSLFAISILGTYLLLNFDSPLTLKQLEHEEHHSLAHKQQYGVLHLVAPIKHVKLQGNDKNKAQLGLQLFLDPRLSSNQQVSCESCHHIFDNGAESIRVSRGVNGTGVRNSPTVFNIAYNSRFFWDGRASSLEKQMDGPVHNPLEMNTNWRNIVEYVQSVHDYRVQFNEYFGGVITEETVKNALVTFMTALNTPDSPFDLFLKGQTDTMEPIAHLGWEKFQSLGCVVCHQGTNIGGNLFQRFGNVSTTTTRERDLGRYNVTGIDSDKGVFRVPSLRNVAKTAPYFHDGRAATLEEAIVTMAKVQLGRELDATTTLEISAFLNALSAPPPPLLTELAQ